MLSLNPEVEADIAAHDRHERRAGDLAASRSTARSAPRAWATSTASTCSTRARRSCRIRKLDLVVAGTEAAVLMVESEAQQLSRGNHARRAWCSATSRATIAINAIHELVRDAGKPVWDWQAPAKDEAFIAKVTALAEEKLRAAYQIRSKQARTQACAKPHAGVMAALKAEGVDFDAVKVEGLLFDIEAKHRAQPDPVRRAAHRRPRHAHRAPDRDPHRRAAAHPRLGAVHARRDAGAGRHHARHRARRAAHRRAGRRVRRPLHAPLQHAAVRHRRDRAAWARPSAARSATAAWPSAR